MSRATEAIQSEATLVQVRVLAAIEAHEWATLYRLSDSLKELAKRGLYHRSLERQAEATRFAAGMPAGP